MLDVPEIQEIVDTAIREVRYDGKRSLVGPRGFLNALFYYIMVREAKSVFKANHEQIFIWATGDHNLSKYIRGTKIEAWRKGPPSQLTRSNSEEFLAAIENSEDFPKWNDYKMLVNKLNLAFVNAEKEKTQQIEMSLGAVARVLADANVEHKVVRCR